MLVLLDIEGAVVVPAEGNGVLQSLQTVLVRAPVRTIAHCRVSVRNELIVVRAERLPCLFRALMQDDYHEGAH